MVVQGGEEVGAARLWGGGGLVRWMVERGGDGLRGGEEEEGEGEGGGEGWGWEVHFWEVGWEVMDGRLGEFLGGGYGLAVRGGEVEGGGGFYILEAAVGWCGSAMRWVELPGVVGG